jgi:hypothetical protein
MQRLRTTQTPLTTQPQPTNTQPPPQQQQQQNVQTLLVLTQMRQQKASL